MKLLVQFMLFFYSLSTLRFKGVCPETFQKKHFSLSKCYINGIVSKIEMEKNVSFGSFGYVL